MRLLTVSCVLALSAASLVCNQNMLACGPSFGAELFEKRRESNRICFWIDIANSTLWTKEAIDCSTLDPDDFTDVIATNPVIRDGKVRFAPTAEFASFPMFTGCEGTANVFLDFNGAASEAPDNGPEMVGPCNFTFSLTTDYCAAPPPTTGQPTSATPTSATPSATPTSAVPTPSPIFVTPSPMFLCPRRRRGGGRRTLCRRVGELNPLFGSAEPGFCAERGQCCGSDYCHREQFEESCEAIGGVWTAGKFCNDTSCVPKQTGQASSGAAVEMKSSLSNAATALEEGGKLDVAVHDVATAPATPVPTGSILVFFSVSRQLADGTPVDEFLPTGEYVLVDVSAGDTFTEATPVIVYRYDETTQEWVDAADDCAAIQVAVAHKFVAPSTWQVPICHTSDFSIALNNATDGDDHDDDKPVKKSKAKPPKKATKATKSGKTKAAKGDPKSAKKDAKKSKKIAVSAGIGAGVAAGIVAAVGGVYYYRRRAQKPKSEAATATATATPSALVSV